MKKKFYLALLLITAICISAGVAQADPEWLAGKWKMGNSDDGEFSIKIEEEDKPDIEIDGLAIAIGLVNFTISDVVEDDGSVDLTLSSKGGYEVSVDDDEVSFEIFLTKEDDLTGLTYEELEKPTLTIVMPIGTDFGPVEAELVIELEDENSATVTISINEEDLEVGELKITIAGSLEFTATKVHERTPSSSGGCDTGAGFGLFLALGALAVFKRAKRKA